MALSLCIGCLVPIIKPASHLFPIAVMATSFTIHSLPLEIFFFFQEPRRKLRFDELSQEPLPLVGRPPTTTNPKPPVRPLPSPPLPLKLSRYNT